MAKKRFITRTIKIIEGKLLLRDASTGGIWEEDYEITGIYADTDKGNYELFCRLNELYRDGATEAIKVLSRNNVEKKYRLNEDDFMRMAENVPEQNNEE